MADPGIYLDSFYIPGLVQDIDWNDFEKQRQETSQFGLDGVTVLYGRRTKRPFSVPMKIYGGYSVRSTFEAFILEIESKENASYTMREFDLSGNQIREVSLTEFSELKRGVMRYDGDLGWWMDAVLNFVQLRP